MSIWSLARSDVARPGRWTAVAVLLGALAGCGGGGASQPSGFVVGGSLAGLAPGRTLALQNNGADVLNLTANGSFTFSRPVAVGASYNVLVKTLPAGQHCLVDGGSGAISSQNVTTISVRCPLEQDLYDFGSAIDTSVGLPFGGVLLASDGTLYGTTAVAGASTGGAIYKVAADGTFTVLHKFGVPDPLESSDPRAGLVDFGDGYYYGTAWGGGVNDLGTVYRTTPAGTVSRLHSFASGAASGARPSANVIRGTDGNYYGTTLEGGSNWGGTVYRLTPAGLETVLWSFQFGEQPYGGLIQASDGNFYGNTMAGGANGGGGVFRITPAGAYTSLWAFGTPGDGSTPMGALIQASDGDLYGTTSAGGAYGFGSVYRLTLAGAVSIVYSFQNTTDGGRPTHKLLQGRDGHLYGTTQLGALCCGTVFRLTTAGVYDVLWEFGSSALAGPPGSDPSDLAQDSSGDLYGTTYGGGQFGLGTVFRLKM